MSRARSGSLSSAAPRGGRPLLVAIVGGSGSGKSWLADKIAEALHPDAIRLSQDDFYRDRSALPARIRDRINFDDPRAIEWARLEEAVLALASGAHTQIPSYSFKTHSRLKRTKTLRPKPVIILDGLWLLRRRKLRPLYALSVFLDCSSRTRLRRRLGRDLRSRGRDRPSVIKQFWTTVEPMHARYVAPQACHADIILSGTESAAQIRGLANKIRIMASAAISESAGISIVKARSSRLRRTPPP